MSLFALPVTAVDLEGLQQGIQFFMNPTEATNEALAINSNTPGGPTVYSYAVQLLAGQISVAQVAMADSALMEGVTVAVGAVRGDQHPRQFHSAFSTHKSRLPLRMASTKRYLLRRPSGWRWRASRPSMPTLAV